MITSKTNAKLKNVRKLLESGKARREQGLFVVEGERIVKEVPKELLEELYLAENSSFLQFLDAGKTTGQAAAQAAEQTTGQTTEKNAGMAAENQVLPAKTEYVKEELFRSLADTVNPQGVLAVVKQPIYDLDDLLSGEEGCYVLLDDLRDPGNLGTILRTCEAAGVNAVIMSKGCVDIFNPKVVRSTMGSIFRVPFINADLNEVICRLKESGCEVYGTSLESAVNYKDISYGTKTAFMIGNEANGIHEELLRQTTANLKIPMQGQVESLNAAVSAAVLLFHLT